LIHCAAHRQLQQLEAFHGKRNHKRNRLSAAALQICARQSDGYEYDSRERFLRLFDLSADVSRFGPSCDLVHALPCPSPEIPAFAQISTSPCKERGEVKKKIQVTNPLRRLGGSAPAQERRDTKN
jgi:hypothetical protein